MHKPWIPVSYGDHPLAAKRARELRRTMTPAERVLWQRLRGGQIAGLRFRRQHAMEGFIADFFCHQARLIIEVDGQVHDQQVSYDRARDDHFARLGYLVLRFTNAQVLKQTDAVTAEIARITAQRFAPLSSRTD